MKTQLIQKEEEFDSHGTGGSNGSFSSAFFNLFKSLVGIGVLALPTAFKNSGWLAGLILLPLCAAGMLYVSNQLMSIADKKNTQAKNLVEFVRETLPKKYIISINICLFAFQIGICISYVIFFIKYIKQSFCKVSDGFICTSSFMAILVSLIILIPLMMIRDLSKLKIWSLIGNIVTVTSLLVVSIYCFIDLGKGDYQPSDAFNFGSIGSSIGVFIFTFEGIGVYFNIRHSMQEPTKFNKVLNLAIVIGISIYCMIGFVGYYTFGDNVNDIILFNFDDSNIPMQIVQLAYCISLILTFPIQISPCVSVAEIKLKQKIVEKCKLPEVEQDSVFSDSNKQNTLQVQNEIAKKFKWQSVLVRLGFVFITFLVGSLFDKVSDFISLTGDVAGIYLCYIVPVLVIYFQDREITAARKYTNYGIMIISIGFGIYGLYSTIIQIGEDFG